MVVRYSPRLGSSIVTAPTIEMSRFMTKHTQVSGGREGGGGREEGEGGREKRSKRGRGSGRERGRGRKA